MINKRLRVCYSAAGHTKKTKHRLRLPEVSRPSFCGSYQAPRGIGNEFITRRRGRQGVLLGGCESLDESD
jgi:hypothetical protein